MYIALLSGFIPELAELEVKRLVQGLDGKAKIDFPLAFIEVDDVYRLKHLGMSHSVFEILPEDFYIDKKYSVKIKGNLNEKEIYDYIYDRSSKNVDLDNPDVEIYVFVNGNKKIFTKKLFDIEKNIDEKRKVPVKKPIVLDPRISRAMINLSGKKTGKLLDPFCGTGLLLKEAAQMGFDVYGSDFSDEMVEASKRNLKHFSLKADIKKMDATKLIYKEKFDCIVTDPPYGISSSLFKKDISDLYISSIKSMKKCLKKDGVIIMAVPEKHFNSIKNLVNNYCKQRVHNSLTRFFVIIQ